MMKKIIIFLLLVVATALLGCNESGMVDSRAERHRRIAAILDIQERQIVDDSDEIWFLDQNLKLTEWNVYLGD